MPPKRFKGEFGIPPSHPPESLLTSALYRLPDSVDPEKIKDLTQTIADRVDSALQANGAERALTEEERHILALKLARHYEDNGESTAIDIPTMTDALIESPRFLTDDRGSIEKLFELHEVKTIQKVAELRRKKAEQTGNEKLNPYENLFETSSGKFYLARLLNMPHLEEESTYLGHCVGTNNSYINKMKRGDVEIFSFRDKATDDPIITIEYDSNNHSLLQVKGERDRIPTLADEFAPDLIETIELLESSVNDNNEKRVVESEEARDLKKLLAIKQKTLEHQELTRDELIFLYEVDELIKGFDSAPEPLIAELRKSRNADEDMLVVFECTQYQIAHDMDSITEHTKVYVGDLAPGIFQKFPETLQHIYTSFPEKKIRRRSVEVGGKSKEQLISEMKAAGINISEYARGLLSNEEEFISTQSKEDLEFVILTVGDLGLEMGATFVQILERAQQLGLEPCPADTGPHWRLEYRNQPMQERFYIGMKPITGDDGKPGVFGLVRTDGSLTLVGDWVLPSYGWHQNFKFAFRHRMKNANSDDATAKLTAS